jgi:2-haloacid dehalogenase
MTSNLPQVLAFDIFGTVVDWHGSIAKEVNAMGLQVDGGEFALAWRAGYQPAMKRVMSGELGWTLIDDLHRMILDDILAQFNITHLSEAEKRHLNKACAGLDPAENQIHDMQPVQRQFGPAHQHGKTRWLALGLHLVSGGVSRLQAASVHLFGCGQGV